MKKSVIIIGISVCILIMIVALGLGAVFIYKNNNTQNPTTAGVSNTTTKADETTSEGVTNFWDNVEVYDETPRPTKKGDETTKEESYPGENEGWSPIVSPDDLEE